MWGSKDAADLSGGTCSKHWSSFVRVSIFLPSVVCGGISSRWSSWYRFIVRAALYNNSITAQFTDTIQQTKAADHSQTQARLRSIACCIFLYDVVILPADTSMLSQHRSLLLNLMQRAAPCCWKVSDWRIGRLATQRFSVCLTCCLLSSVCWILSDDALLCNGAT